MALGGGVPVDMFVPDEGPSRGLGAILAGAGRQQHALPLARVAIAATVADRIAQVTIEQVFRNTCSEPIEAVYTFPLDGGAIVSRFEMQVAERTLRGVIAERGAARHLYDRALEEGKRAALLEQERDDVFTIQLGNLPPGEDATIRLTYSEELTFFDDGVTELRLPLVLGVRYVPGEPSAGLSAGHGVEPDTDVVGDASRITPPRLADGFDPGVHLALSAALSGGPLTDLMCSQHAVRLVTEGGGTTISLARDDERLNRDFVLRWRAAAPGAIAPTLFFYRQPSGERYGIVSVGAATGAGQVRPRDVVFVLDRSGSMQGLKMASAARACSLLLGTLGPQDRFGLLAFNDRAQWLIGTGSADALVAADRAGISRGERVLRELQAHGGTELFPALQSALGGTSVDIAGRLPVVVLITDGEVGDESRALQLVQRATPRVFTVGVDTSVNSGLLKRMAQVGRGTFVLTEPGAGLDVALEAIAREIGAPLVENLTLALDGGTVTDVAPERLPDLFAGRAATIAFRADTGVNVHITGRRADGGAFSLDVTGTDVDLPAIAHLWARRRLTDLEDRYRLVRGDKTAIEAEIVALSTSHGVLSRFTAFLVVDDRQAVVSSGERRTVVQPVEMPHLWARGNSLDETAELTAFELRDRSGSSGFARVERSGPRVTAELGRRLSGMSMPALPRFLSRVRPGSIRPAAPGSSEAITTSARQRMDELGNLLERLLTTLEKRAEPAGPTAGSREALEILERLLALLAGSGRSRELRRLAGALEALRNRLHDALTAEHELDVASTQLKDLWAELSPVVPTHARFWDTV